MSLFFHRLSIERSVAGNLPLGADQRLRSHLRRCEACRGHYDALMLVAAVAAPVGKIAAERERARVLSNIGHVPEPTPAPRRRWLVAAAVPVFAVAAFMLFRRTDTVTAPDSAIAWRGGSEADSGASQTASLLLFASSRGPDGKSGPVRLVGDFPLSGEGTVGRSEHLQFAYQALRAPAFIIVLGKHTDGEQQTFVAVPGHAPLPASVQARPLGAMLEPGVLKPGIWRLLGIVSPVQISIEEARGALLAGRGRWRLPGYPIAAVLNVQP